MMATRKVATVFGGSGFIGRYVVKRLAAAGHVVRVAVRDPEAALFLKPMGSVGQVVPLHASLVHEATVHRAVDGAELVVNLVGILAEQRPGDFERLQAEGAGRVARVAAAAGVRRLVQMSSLGADPNAASKYASSKGRGEVAVLAEFPKAAILRPSVLFGPEDNFFNQFAALGRLLPFMPVFCGDSRMQPVYVGDVADAVMAGLTRTDAAGGTFEIGGPRVWQFREILRYILMVTQRRRRLVDIPMGIARLQAAICEHVPGKPLTRDQLIQLAQDNIVAPGARDLASLGIVATPVEAVVPDYLRRFRAGGGRVEAMTA